MEANKPTLFILPHLDDEFALGPLIKMITREQRQNCFFLYCAEHLNNPNRLARKREALLSADYFSVENKNIFFLNDHLKAEIRKLHEVFHPAALYLHSLIERSAISQIVTFAFEGGHPDHDLVALLTDHVCQSKNVRPYFVPAYNRCTSRSLLKIQVCKPLNSQRYMYRKFPVPIFAWKSALKIAFIYRTQLKTFCILTPFMAFKTIFHHFVYLTDRIDVTTVAWNTSLSNLRYQARFEDIKPILDHCQIPYLEGSEET